MTIATIDTALIEDRQYIARELGFEPSSVQATVLQCTERNRLLAGGERSGKSEVGANDVFGSIFRLGAKLIWLFGADYDETSQEYQYCIRNATTLDILRSAKKGHNPGEILLTNGTVIKTVSGTVVTKIGREAPDYILVCEAAKIDYMTYLRLRARLAEKRGHMLMTGTFEGSLGWYPELFTSWQLPGAEGRSFSMPTWSNLAIFPGGREDLEIKRLEAALPKDLFDERLGGTPCPPHGMVFQEFKITHHVRDIDVNKDFPVHVWIDPGYAGAYAVEVVQIINDVVYVVDEVYEQYKTTREIIQICKLKPWWRQVSPHGVIDVAGRQHQAMESVAEVWASTGPDGAGINLAMQPVPVQPGIDRYRDFLKINPMTNRPSVVISPKCHGLISEHGGEFNPFTHQQAVYRYRVDKEGQTQGEEPEDKHNHAIKAMTYGIVDRFGYVLPTGGKRRVLQF